MARESNYVSREARLGDAAVLVALLVSLGVSTARLLYGITGGEPFGVDLSLATVFVICSLAGLIGELASRAHRSVPVGRASRR